MHATWPYFFPNPNPNPNSRCTHPDRTSSLTLTLTLTHVARVLTVLLLDNRLEVVVHLRAHLHRLRSTAINGNQQQSRRESTAITTAINGNHDGNQRQSRRQSGVRACGLELAVHLRAHLHRLRSTAINSNQRQSMPINANHDGNQQQSTAITTSIGSACACGLEVVHLRAHLHRLQSTAITTAIKRQTVAIRTACEGGSLDRLAPMGRIVNSLTLAIPLTLTLALAQP